MTQIQMGVSVVGFIVFVLVTLMSGYTPFRWAAILLLYIEAMFQQIVPAARVYAAGFHARVTLLKRGIAGPQEEAYEIIKIKRQA